MQKHLFGVLFLFIKEEMMVKVKVATKQCKGCLWLKQGLCMFQRCVKRYGFIADKKEEK
jgi:hypothetical protein